MIDDDVNARRDVNRMGVLVALALLGILTFLVYALIYVEVPAANQSALLVVVGIISAATQTLVSWLFGSTSANKQKDSTIATMAATQKSSQAALAPVAGAPTAATEIPVAVGDAVTVKAVEET